MNRTATDADIDARTEVFKTRVGTDIGEFLTDFDQCVSHELAESLSDTLRVNTMGVIERNQHIIRQEMQTVIINTSRNFFANRTTNTTDASNYEVILRRSLSHYVYEVINPVIEAELRKYLSGSLTSRTVDNIGDRASLMLDILHRKLMTDAYNSYRGMKS